MWPWWKLGWCQHVLCCCCYFFCRCFFSLTIILQSVKKKKSLILSFLQFAFTTLPRNQGIISFCPLVFVLMLFFSYLSPIFLQGRQQSACNEGFSDRTKQNMTITLYNTISSLATHFADTTSKLVCQILSFNFGASCVKSNSGINRQRFDIKAPRWCKIGFEK